MPRELKILGKKELENEEEENKNKRRFHSNPMFNVDKWLNQ